MKIQFCDLCNESVPESDFAAGRAFRRQGRVVCAVCDASMSSADGNPKAMAGVGAAHLPHLQSHGHAPGTAHAHPHPHSHAGGHAGGHARPESAPSRGAWVAVLALLLTTASAWVVSGELSEMREQEKFLRSSMDEQLVAIGGDLDEFSLSAQRRDQELEGRLRTSLVQQRSEFDSTLAALGDNLSAAKKQLKGMESELLRLAEEQQNGDDMSGKRIDDLLAQSMKSRQVLDSLATRLEQSERALADARVAAPLKKAEPTGPKYAARLADLTNSAASTRWNAVQSLGETGDPEVVPYLIPLLADSDVFVRMAVARVFGDLASPLAIEPLIEALQDEESVMREAAMAALHIITGRDFRFDPFAKPADRAKRVQAWRDWWKGAKDEYFGDL